MLEIICFGALALTTELCASPGVNLTASNAIDFNTTATIHIAGRPYESDYTREAEKIKERQDLRNHRNSDSRRYRNYRGVDLRNGGCVDERGRIYRNPDEECFERRETDRIYRTPERRYERRDRIHREPHYRR